MSIFPTSDKYRPSNPVLRGIVSGLANAEETLIADQMLPILFNATRTAAGEETYSSGIIQRYAAAAFFGDAGAADEVGAGEPFPRSRGADLDPLTYLVAKYGREGTIPMEVARRAANAGMPTAINQFSLMMGAPITELQILKERRFAALLQTAANWTTNTATIVAGSGWNNTGSDPIGDINAMVHKISAYGRMPTDIMIPRQAVIDLQTNSQFNEFRSTNEDRTMLSIPMLTDTLKNRFGFKRVHYGMARYNSSTVPGTLTGTDIYTDTVWMGCLALGTDAGVSVGNGAVQLNPTAFAGIVENDWTVDQYEEKQSQRLVGQAWYSRWEGIVQEQLGGVIIDTNNTAP